MQKIKQGYLPTLDGWRAIAILFVLLDHAPTVHAGPLSTWPFHYLGGFGVQICVALRGLLITTRLLSEEAVSGTLNLKGFYIRRLTRIQPAALTFLAVVAVLMLLHRLPSGWLPLLCAVLMVRNYTYLVAGPAGWPTVHFWSLSVEEHFYLLLPTFLRKVRRRRAAILIGLAIADMLYWLIWQLHIRWAATTTYFHTDTNAHFLLLPAGIAVLLTDDRHRRSFARWLRPWWTLPVSAIILFFSKDPIHHAYFLLPSLLVLSTFLHPGGLAGRFLELAPLRFIGRISYSLYLWQELFMTGFWQPSIHPFGLMRHNIYYWGCTFLLALASYYLIERPCIRWGHRLAKPVIAGRPDLPAQMIVDPSQNEPIPQVNKPIPS